MPFSGRGGPARPPFFLEEHGARGKGGAVKAAARCALHNSYVGAGCEPAPALSFLVERTFPVLYLVVTRRFPPENQVLFLSFPHRFPAACQMYMNMGCAVSLGTSFHLMVFKALVQVFRLAYIAWGPVARIRLLCENVIPWLLLKGCTDGVYIILIPFPRKPLPREDWGLVHNFLLTNLNSSRRPLMEAYICLH